MKKALVCILPLALLLVLTACGETPDGPMAYPGPGAFEPPIVETTAPETAPPETSAPEPVSDTVPAAPVENGNPQGQAETATPEAAVSEPVDLFTEADETVYATGSVNIRASWSADSERLGALSWGESVTRTGIGTDEAENWSRVTLADSSTAYISSKYLSTSKPVQQNSGTTSNKGSTSSTSNQGYAQNSPNWDPDRAWGGENGPKDDAFVGNQFEGMTDEEIQAYIEENYGDSWRRTNITGG